MSLIINGHATTLIPDGDRVRNELAFFPEISKNTSAFKSPPRRIVLHWTGAENPASRVVRTLQRRGLSIHFVIEKDGTIVQTADIMTRCAHAGIANDSIGIEIVSRGFASKADMAGQKGLRDRTDLDWAEGRDVFRDRIGGRSVNLASYYLEQIDSVLWLCETLCGLLLIPRRVPFEILDRLPADERMRRIAVRTPMGYAVPLFDRDVRGKWSPRGKGRALTFEGVIGHFHVHRTKFDCGTQPFLALWCEGFAPTGRKLFDYRELVT